MADGGNVVIKINGDDSGYTDKIDGLAQKTKLHMADVKAAIDLATAALRKMYGVLKDGVSYNATIQSTQVAFETMTGSAEKAADMMERIIKMGAETPFETADLASTVQLLMQYGFAADDAVEKMSMLGDIAQGNAQAMTSIATGYAQMSSAGKVNLQDIKQMINGGFNPLQEISERTGESMASLYDRISKGTMAVEEITESMRYATSEGGKFYQSMEKQSQTLNGQLSTLKDNASQLLGAMTSGISEQLQDKYLPMLNDAIGQLSDAFANGGFDGMFDSAINMLPTMLGEIESALGKVFDSLTKKLPTLIQKLVGQIPSALKSMSTMIPQLVSVLFEVMSSTVEQVITMLPELVPAIIEGLGKMLISAFEGVLNVLNGIGEGIRKALVSIGLLAPTAREELHMLIEDATNVDDVKKASELMASVTVKTTVTTEEYKTKIDAAIQSIIDYVNGLNGLNTEQKEGLANAIISGSGYDAMVTALVSIGVSTNAAEAFVTAVSASMGTINSTIAALGLSPAAEAKLRELSSGKNTTKEQIVAYLISCGIPEDTAKAAAESIQTENGKINAAAAEIGLNETTTTALTTSSNTDKALISAALLACGMKPEDVQQVLKGYAVVSGSIYAGVGSVFDKIADAFTDGKADTQEVVDGAIADIEGWQTETIAKINVWQARQIAALALMGLTADQYATKKEEIDKQAEEMKTTVNDTTAAVIAWIQDAAGKSTEYVQAHVDELYTLLGEAKSVSAAIDALSDGNVDANRTARTLTITGATTDASNWERAIALTKAELEQAIDTAEAEYAQVVEDARNKVTNDEMDSATYQGIEAEARAKLEQATSEATALYDSMMMDVLAGMASTNPALAEKLQGLVQENLVAGAATAIREAFKDPSKFVEGGEVDTAALWESIFSSTSEADFSKLASEMGLSANELKTEIVNTLKNGGSIQGNEILEALFYFEPSNTDTLFQSLLDTLDFSSEDFSGLATTLTAAINDGYITPAIDGIDTTTAEGAMQVAVAKLLQSFTTAAEEAPETDTNNVGSKLLTNVVNGLNDAFTGTDVNLDGFTGKFRKLISGAMEATEVEPTAQENPFSGVIKSIKAALQDPNLTSGDGVDASALMASIFSSSSEVDYNALASQMGFSVEDLTTAIVNAAKTGQPESTSIWNDLVSFEAIDTTAATTAGTNMATAFTTAVEDGSDSASTAGETVATSTTKSMDKPTLAYTAGGNVATGFINGVVSYCNSNAYKVRVAINSILALFNKVPKINSPSKVTMKSGEGVGEGFELGIKTSMEKATETAKRVTQNLMDTMGISTSSMSYGTEIRVTGVDAISDAVNRQNEAQTAVYLDGKQIAAIQASNNTTAISLRNRTIANGYGRR